MSHRIEVDGEVFLELETVAEVFRVDSIVLREAYAVGLLGTCMERDAHVLIAVASLDRVATIVRLRVVLGMDLDAIDLALACRPD